LDDRKRKRLKITSSSAKNVG